MLTGHIAPTPTRAQIASTMAKARVLREAVPYIKEFRGKTVVVKYGGAAMLDEDLRRGFAGDIALLKLVGINPVVVHGGGPDISRRMEQEGLEPKWVKGLRVTDRETLQVVKSVLVDEINPAIVQMLQEEGIPAVGLSGVNSELLIARQQNPALEMVGEVSGIDPQVIQGLEGGEVAVVAPMGRGEDGEIYNLNADIAAGSLAGALGARKLVYLTDVEGLYRDLGDRNTLITRMSLQEVNEMVDRGVVSRGMLPKLESCIQALEAGVPQAHILDGRIQHALLLEIFTPEGIGTMITKKGG